MPGTPFDRRGSRGERSNCHISCGPYLNPCRELRTMLLNGGPDRPVPLANSAAEWQHVQPQMRCLSASVSMATPPNSSRQVPGTMQAGYMRSSLGTNAISESIHSTIYLPTEIITCLHTKYLAFTALPIPTHTGADWLPLVTALRGLCQHQWDLSGCQLSPLDVTSIHGRYPPTSRLHHIKQTMDIATHSTLAPPRSLRHQQMPPVVCSSSTRPTQKVFSAHHYTKSVPFSAQGPGRGAAKS